MHTIEQPSQELFLEENTALGTNHSGLSSNLVEKIVEAMATVKSQLQREGKFQQAELQEKFGLIENLVQTIQKRSQINLTVAKKELFKHERYRGWKIARQIRDSHNLDELLNNSVAAVREELQATRIIIYRFSNESEGQIIAEALSPGWTPAIGEKLPCLCFGAQRAVNYSIQQVVVVENTETARLTPYQVQLLARFQVKAYIALPIMLGKDVWGLLVAQQCTEPRPWQEADINLLDRTVTELAVALQPEQVKLELQQQVEREKAITTVVQKLQQATDLYAVFRTATQEAKQLLKADRVVVYRFNPDWSGEVVAESVEYGWKSVMEIQKQDPTLYNVEMSAHEQCTLKNLEAISALETDTYLRNTKGGSYAKGKKFQVVNDVYTANFSACYLQSLEKYQTKAYIIVPIFQEKKLWGLFAAYQNSAPRTWASSDISLMLQLSNPLGIALKQTEYLYQLQSKLEQEKAIEKIVNSINQSGALEDIFPMATKEVRELLKADRVVIYRFNADWNGEVIAEAVGGNWQSVLRGLNAFAADTHFLEAKGENYNKGQKFHVVNDIYQAGLSRCYLENLEKYQAKAYIIVPILQNNKLKGLFAVYQNSGARTWLESEINLMLKIAPQLSFALQQASYLGEIKAQSERLEKTITRERGLAKLLERMQQARTSETIFRAVPQEARKMLDADRVVIYRFNPDWSGEFVGESTVAGWSSLMGKMRHLRDTFLQEHQGGRYQHRESLTVNDIYKADHDACHVELLEQMEARAYMIAPIFLGDKLWGLVGAYENSAPREWEEDDISVLNQVGVQIGIALQQTEYLEKLRLQSEDLAATAARETAAKQELQQRAVEMLTSIRPAFRGDLSVRATVTEDEIGTIAGAFNTTLDSLRDIVIQVKTAVEQVALTTNQSNTAITGLSEKAQQQFLELNQALEQIQGMLDSTEVTTKNAQKVEKAIQQANQTVQIGDKAMNNTVESILGIRQTVAEAGKHVKRLSDSSQKISKVVSLIGSFATQTNLLALNAALEATRAGEYGKGFAVVADEVRNLSLQSAEATTEIEKLVQEIQGETQQVTAAMDTGIQQVLEGSNLVNETRESLNAIVAATAEIRQLVAGITQAANAQAKQAESVAQVMTQVAMGANDTSEDSLKISASFHELLTMAQNLQASVAQFKIK